MFAPDPSVHTDPEIGKRCPYCHPKPKIDVQPMHTNCPTIPCPLHPGVNSAQAHARAIARAAAGYERYDPTDMAFWKQKGAASG